MHVKSSIYSDDGEPDYIFIDFVCTLFMSTCLFNETDLHYSLYGSIPQATTAGISPTIVLSRLALLGFKSRIHVNQQRFRGILQF